VEDEKRLLRWLAPKEGGGGRRTSTEAARYYSHIAGGLLRLRVIETRQLHEIFLVNVNVFLLSSFLGRT
jgi:hypothetical protein